MLFVIIGKFESYLKCSYPASQFDKKLSTFNWRFQIFYVQANFSFNFSERYKLNIVCPFHLQVGSLTMPFD